MVTALLLGRAVVDVTPPAGLPLDGYLARGDARATGGHDPLQATAFWLSTPDDPGVLWLSLDALAVDAPLARDLAAAVTAATGVPADRVLVCASHTHSGPVGWTGPLHPALPGRRDPDLVRALVAKVRTGLTGLAARRVPVRLSWGAPAVPGVGANRHDPAGPHDDTAGILAAHPADDPAAPPLAVLLDHASHPTVLGPDNLRWSADWPGATRRALTAAPGCPDLTVAFLPGAAGDVSPRFLRRGRDHAEVTRIGQVLATATARALADPGRHRWTARPAVHRTTLRLPVRARPDPCEVDSALSLSDTPADRIRQTAREGAHVLAGLRHVSLPAELALPLTAVTLGGLAWLHLPVELVAALGLRIRALSPFPATRVIGYTDGYTGYLATAADHQHRRYEALISLFDAPAADLLVSAAVDLLHTAATATGGSPRPRAGSARRLNPAPLDPDGR